jgi:hypothetical protein
MRQRCQGQLEGYFAMNIRLKFQRQSNARNMPRKANFSLFNLKYKDSR